MTTGSCLCGTVRYQIEGPFQWMTHCHCSMCRKHHGSLFCTTLGVAPEKFRWLQGQDAIVHYSASPAFERPFCRECGSTVPDTSGAAVVCPAGGLDSDPAARPDTHIFMGSRSPMHEVDDGLQSFDESLPGYETPKTTTHAATSNPSDGSVHGTCLCGSVAFEIDEQPRNLVNCHCSRCRKSRGAAFGTNFFARIDKLRWTRGADKVRSYKPPEADLFTTSFCADCGSLLPAPFQAIKRYIVPAGSLDAPLPIRVSINIWVGSKAPWFEITDGLPQFEAMPPSDRVRELMF